MYNLVKGGLDFFPSEPLVYIKYKRQIIDIVSQNKDCVGFACRTGPVHMLICKKMSIIQKELAEAEAEVERFGMFVGDVFENRPCDLLKVGAKRLLTYMTAYGRTHEEKTEEHGDDKAFVVSESREHAIPPPIYRSRIVVLLRGILGDAELDVEKIEDGLRTVASKNKKSCYKVFNVCRMCEIFKE